MSTIWAYNGGCDYYRTSSLVSPKAAQSIVAPDAPDFAIETVGLYLTRNLDSGTIHVELYAADASGFPTGEVLSSGTVESASLPTGTVWTVDTPITVVNMSPYNVSFSGNGFVIVMYGDNYISESPYYSHIYWHGVNEGAYSYGVGSRFTTAWANLATQDLRFYVTGTTGTGLSKPTTPTPANSSGPGIDFSTRTLSWVNGGGAETYTVRIGPYPLATNAVSVSQVGTSYVIPTSDIVLYKNNPISWRVDAEAGGETVEGDVWTFDPRPGKVTTPVPSNSGTGISKGLSTVSWAAGLYADSYNVVLSWFGGVTNPNTSGTSYDFGALTPLSFNPLSYNTEHTWRIDSVNVWGTTTGDTWSFTTLDLDFPKTIYFYPGTGWYYLIWDDSTNSWGDPPPVGTIDVDYKVATFINFIGSHRCLVSLAKDSLWYESVN